MSSRHDGPVRITLLLCSALALLAFACGGQGPARELAAASTTIEITGTGTDEADAFCSDFTLTEDEVRTFFERASYISARELHDDYDWLPCYVDGFARTSSGVVRWRIRAGGTGEVIFPSDSTRLVGCQDCNDILR